MNERANFCSRKYSDVKCKTSENLKSYYEIEITYFHITRNQYVTVPLSITFYA